MHICLIQFILDYVYIIKNFRKQMNKKKKNTFIIILLYLLYPARFMIINSGCNQQENDSRSLPLANCIKQCPPGFIISNFQCRQLQYQMIQEIQISSQSLDQLTIGFEANRVKDYQGNILQDISETVELTESIGINKQILQSAKQISYTVIVAQASIMIIMLLFLIKGGYTVLLTFEILQIYYMHIFLLLDPLPYLQYTFLYKLKYFSLAFFPSLFDNYLGDYEWQKTPSEYSSFLNDASFLRNCSPFIFMLIISIAVYLFFKILTVSKINKWKRFRRFCQSVVQQRLEFTLFNQAFWFTYINTMYFAILQFKSKSFTTQIDKVNISFAVISFIILIGYNCVIIIWAFKLKNLKQQTRAYSFLVYQPDSYANQLPVRLFRKFLIAISLILPNFQYQIFALLGTNFCFFIYLIFFKPSSVKLNLVVNFIVELLYLSVEITLVIFDEIQMKTDTVHYKFGLILATIQGFLIFFVLLWLFYRSYEWLRSTLNKEKIINNKADKIATKSFETLKDDQVKKDLAFDFGQHQIQTESEKTDPEKLIQQFGVHFKNKNLVDNKQQKILFNLQKPKKNNKSSLYLQQDSNIVFKKPKNVRVIEVNQDDLIQDPIQFYQKSKNTNKGTIKKIRPSILHIKDRTQSEYEEIKLQNYKKGNVAISECNSIFQLKRQINEQKKVKWQNMSISDDLNS